MCLCTPSIRTPWCHNCAPRLGHASVAGPHNEPDENRKIVLANLRIQIIHARAALKALEALEEIMIIEG